MTSNTWLRLPFLFCCVIAASACQNDNFNAKYNISRKGILCSTQSEDISTVVKKILLIKSPNVIGIYELPKAIGYVCYWKPVGTGLVDLMTLNGGIFHMTGKVVVESGLVDLITLS